MRKKLCITSRPHKRPNWNAVAQVMRDNAHGHCGSRKDGGPKQTGSMTAIDQLYSFAAITDAQAAGIP